LIQTSLKNNQPGEVLKIVVAGAGEVGFHLIENLRKNNLDIIAIDTNLEVLEKLKRDFGVTTDHSSIVDSKYLSSKHLSDAELFLAITNSDETNMIACKLASEAGVDKTICRIRQIDLKSDYKGFSLKSLGIDWVINPVYLVADEIVRLIMTPNIVDSHEFLNGKILLTGYRITETSKIIGKSIRELGKDTKDNLFQIAVIQRKNVSHVPQKDDVIKYGDIVYFIYKSENFKSLRKFLGYAQRSAKTKQVFINGGGNIGLRLAEQLEIAKQEVKVIEQDLSRSYRIAETLQKALVLNFDGTDLHQLTAENIENADYFIAVTDSESQNLTSCLLAGKQGVEKTVCLVQQPELVQIIDQNSPISIAISPRILTARYLVQFIQGTNISSYFSMINGQIEILEISLDAQAKCLGIRLKDISLPENVMIGIIKRKDSYLIPRGDTKIIEGDIVLVVLHRFDRNKALGFFLNQ
jgi:trk/ktr system potassium uptake protein